MQVDFQSKIGLFKPINGASRYDTEDTEAFFSYGFPSVRLHDQDGPRPFCVDIAGLFPYDGADENDPSSYDFLDTDRVMSDLVFHGVTVIYRLGNSIDHTKYKRLSRVPRDFKKWAKICEHVIAHYTEGWNNGFYYDLPYWEIWNEPDLIYLNLTTMWQGTEEEFFDLYRVASCYLKKRFPHLKIGGYGAARSRAPFFEHFLNMVENEHLPLDFFSWHRYGSEIEELIAQAERVRTLLDQHGCTHTESILDEWSYTENDWFGQNAWGVIDENPRLNEAFYSKMRGPEGASYIAACQIAMLDAPVDQAQIYDCQRGDFGLMYDKWGNLTKTATTLIAFNQMARRSRVAATCEIPGVYVAAGADTPGADVVISCFECRSSESSITLCGCGSYSVGKVLLTDRYFSNEKITEVPVKGDTLELQLSIRPYTVIHITLEKEGSHHGF